MKALKDIYRFVRKPPRWRYPSPIKSEEMGNQELQKAIASGRSFLAGRFGSVELESLERHLRAENGHGYYSDKLKTDMSNNAGFFPTDDGSLDAFGEEYGRATAALDFLGLWFNPHEDLAVRKLCPEATLIPLRALEPYYFVSPWSAALEGKRVLVVHPFADSIQRRYQEARTDLFRNPHVLPSFHLMTLKAVQSHAGAVSGFASWFEALDDMKCQMAALNFDVCIVGAGAYGLPLACYAKSQGKQAIHMGGATQVLFGIIGRRWEQHPVIRTFINSAWKRPTEEETPPDARSVENGCYW